MVCGREGLDLVWGQQLAPLSPANPVPCLLLCPCGCHVRASCVWHRPWSIFTIAAPRQQRFGHCRVLVSVFIWAPAASPAFNPLLALATPFFRQVLRKNNTHLASFWGHGGCLASDGFWQLLCRDQMSRWHPGFGFSPRGAWSLSCLPWGSVWHPGLCLCGAGRGYPAERG